MSAGYDKKGEGARSSYATTNRRALKPAPISEPFDASHASRREVHSIESRKAECYSILGYVNQSATLSRRGVHNPSVHTLSTDDLLQPVLLELVRRRHPRLPDVRGCWAPPIRVVGIQFRHDLLSIQPAPSFAPFSGSPCVDFFHCRREVGEIPMSRT